MTSFNVTLFLETVVEGEVVKIVSEGVAIGEYPIGTASEDIIDVISIYPPYKFAQDAIVEGLSEALGDLEIIGGAEIDE